MNLIRLGDRIIDRQRSSERQKSIQTADYIAQNVFDAQLEIDDIINLYLFSTPLVKAPKYLQESETQDLMIGEFEAICLDKLLKPKRPVFAIVGPMGCGKSTTMNYVGLHLIKDKTKGEQCKQNSKRLIGYIDFNLHQLNSINNTKLKDSIREILTDELWAKLRTSDCYFQDDELVDFWNLEISKYTQHKSKSIAFRKIIASLDDVRTDNLSDAAIRNRKNILDEIIKKDSNLYLDYLVHLWKYNIERNLGSNGCAYIILDNIDILHPMAQRVLMHIVVANSRAGGPTFVLLVRPETFDYAGLGTNVIDIESHQGPSPIQVVKDRLQRFCDDPESFYNPNASLSRDDFELIRDYMLQTQVLIDSDSRKEFEKFLEYSCGTSIRSALLMAQGLFGVSRADMETDVSTRDIIRACITQGEDQVRWSSRSSIEHLFRISTSETNAYLLKPRILRYLGRHEKGRRRLGEIVYTLNGFGYSDDVIREALNDMMQINHQLIRSNGFDYYGSKKNLEENFGDYVMLTKTGRGYSDHLVMNVDYLQEIMLDTYIDGDRIPQYIDVDYLSEKFHLLHIFLNELREYDIKETDNFLSKWTCEAYLKIFGLHLITLDIIQGVYPPVIGISKYQARKYPYYASEYNKIIADYKSLALQVEADNNRLLGIWVDSVVDVD